MRSALLLVAALAALPGCNIFVDAAQCPSLDDVCPDLQCDDYKQDRDGCSICECTTPEVTVCWDSSECGAGQRCDSVDFCEPAPNCEGDGPCPDACYGRCVDAPASCTSDADCAAGQACALIDNGGDANQRPAPPPDQNGDAAPQLPAPAGVCVDANCAGAGVALPECPPGTEVGLAPSGDPCALGCVPVDGCRGLAPDQCQLSPGCQLIDDPAGNTLCGAVDDCSVLGPDSCESNPNCILKSVDGTNAGASGGGSDGAPAPCDAADPNCTGTDPAPPPPPDLVCVPRSSDGGDCFSDADCFAGEVCSLTTVCGSGCEVNADGSQTCFDQCWTESGVCGPSDQSCGALTPDQCSADPRCTLVDGGTSSTPCGCDPSTPNGCDCAQPAPQPVCVPASPSCTADADCLDGQHCELVESCPACDPSGNDLNCAAPCFVEGTCVDGAPPPAECNSDADCGPGGACVAVSVCGTCAEPPAPGGDGSGVAPPPCDPDCRPDNVCVQVEPTCFADADCSPDEFCDFSLLACGPGALVAQCPGLCAPLAPPATCQADGDCPAGQRCAVELDGPVCVDDTGASGTFCLDDSACASADGTVARGSCRFDPDVCLDDPNSDLAVCSGWCAAQCADVVTAAMDPVSGQCVVFQDSCIPPGWVVTNGC